MYNEQKIYTSETNLLDWNLGNFSSGELAQLADLLLELMHLRLQGGNRGIAHGQLLAQPEFLVYRIRLHSSNRSRRRANCSSRVGVYATIGCRVLRRRECRKEQGFVGR